MFLKKSDKYWILVVNQTWCSIGKCFKSRTLTLFFKFKVRFRIFIALPRWFSLIHIKTVTNVKIRRAENLFQLHQKWCLFLQLAETNFRPFLSWQGFRNYWSFWICRFCLKIIKLTGFIRSWIYFFGSTQKP